jgi:hypothetical protein
VAIGVGTTVVGVVTASHVTVIERVPDAVPAVAVIVTLPPVEGGVKTLLAAPLESVEALLGAREPAVAVKMTFVPAPNGRSAASRTTAVTAVVPLPQARLLAAEVSTTRLAAVGVPDVPPALALRKVQ